MIKSDERTEALCKFEGAKKDLQNLGMKAAYYIQELRKETNTLITGKDFLSMNFTECQKCVDELKDLQKEGKEKLELINELNKIYKFE
jgi:hypothetical protein